jgi:hypothetical protein
MDRKGLRTLEKHPPPGIRLMEKREEEVGTVTGMAVTSDKAG